MNRVFNGYSYTKTKVANLKGYFWEVNGLKGPDGKPLTFRTCKALKENLRLLPRGGEEGGAEAKRTRLEAAKVNLECMKGAVTQPMFQYASDVVTGLERLEAEKDALRQLDLPAAFGGKPIPDTDAARLARRQVQITKGIDVP
jgi:hypothetical protein